jgi:cell division protein FtsI/penicillin-binding protein 2
MIRRWSLTLWAGLAVLAYSVLIFRLFSIQVLNGKQHRRTSWKQSQELVTLEARRGDIYDSNLNKLAFDVEQYSYGINPKRLTNRQELASAFSRMTGNSEGHYLKLLKSNGFVWLARGLDQQTAKKINLSRIGSVVTEKTFGRYYPYQRSAAHVIGFTNIDHVGIAGIEKNYQEFLKGKPGYKTVNVDARGQTIPVLGEPEEKPIDGISIVLTLDINYQMIAEEELKKGIDRYRAKAGILVMMRPGTGEIIGLASYPNFNPNHFSSFESSERRNRALVDPFEPGSTYKLVTAAAALERGVAKSTDVVYCENGKGKFPGGWIRDHKPYGDLTFKQVFSNSSNIGTAKIAGMVEKKWIYEYSRALGFGSVTGLDISGEHKGKLTNYVAWSKSDAARVPIGYGVMATAVQITNAYAVIANGGYLLKPRLLKAVMRPDSPNRFEETKVDTVRRALKPETVAVLKSFMRNVVENGTGRKAAVHGITVAGKTGTTKKYDSVAKSYSDSKYIASFVGFAPVDHPKLVCLVILDEPTYPNYYGGLSATPIFCNVIRRIMGLMSDDTGGVFVSGEDARILVPDLTELPIQIAKSILSDFGFEARTEGVGEFVVAQYPPPRAVTQQGEVIKLKLGDKSKQERFARRIPDVRGKSSKEAIMILTQAGLNPTLQGSGVVVAQLPAPNSLVDSQNCKIICRPKSG